MPIFEDAGDPVPAGGKGRGKIDPEYMEFARSLLTVPDGHARPVRLPFATYELVVREVHRACRRLDMGFRAEWDKTASGEPVVTNDKVLVRFAGWPVKKRNKNEVEVPAESKTATVKPAARK